MACAVESLMVLLYNMLGGTVDVYTMDHRGTGRSHRLTCDASQAEMSGSTQQKSIAFTELPDCIEDITNQLGGMQSYLFNFFIYTHFT